MNRLVSVFFLTITDERFLLRQANFDGLVKYDNDINVKLFQERDKWINGRSELKEVHDFIPRDLVNARAEMRYGIEQAREISRLDCLFD